MELLLSLWTFWAEGTEEKSKGVFSTSTATAFEMPSLSFLWLPYTSVLKGTSWRQREESGLRALLSPAGLPKVAQDNVPSRMFLGCSISNLDVHQVGIASRDLRAPSLSRRTATEMAFHELNYVLGFKANMAQRVFPSHQALSQRSEVVPGKDGTAIPRNQPHQLSYHRALTKKPFTHIWGGDTDPELMASAYLHFFRVKLMQSLSRNP